MQPQSKYSQAETELIKVLFPDANSLTLLRRYLLNLPISEGEVAQIKGWTSPEAVAVIRRAFIPTILGTEPPGTGGYDVLNNIDKNERDDTYLTAIFMQHAEAISFVDGRLNLLAAGDIGAATAHPTTYLTAYYLNSIKAGKEKRQDQWLSDITDQLRLLGLVEGSIMSLNALISVSVETEEQKAARIKADSTK